MSRARVARGHASSEIDELHDLAEPGAHNLADATDHAVTGRQMIERLGSLLSKDPRWVSYWSSFRLDHYFELPESKSADMQLRAMWTTP
jgi:hypothetical protein